jgi:hypothetical protein
MKNALIILTICLPTVTSAHAQELACSTIKKADARLACYDRMMPPRARPAKDAASLSAGSNAEIKNDAVGKAGEIRLPKICRGC